MCLSLTPFFIIHPLPSSVVNLGQGNLFFLMVHA
jgi:hypothetical protein